ncbi:hypothetical protein PENTCL1PPCAC_29658 [Pristionchus entomophagus]|uniref:CAAX prenyl protease n=1 Tax=Pristionchus entomophagus TaxID=358040 RepID=A0AAV5UMB7_9BILA|nr:hypothetical protein PENTCL1PPCAC_29658 [Pristionchus entomophagus]
MDPRLLLHSIVGVNFLLFLWEFFLTYRQKAKHDSTPKRPREVESIISEGDFVKARSYSIDHLSFSMIRMLIECGIMIAMLYGGYYSYLWSLSELTAYPIAAFLILHYLIAFIIDLPLSLYENFVIEDSHGFNKYTISFYMFDAVKKLILTTVITIPLGWGAVWLMENGGDLFFIYLWLFISVVILGMMTIYPAYIAPLFDQYSPLPDGQLKTAIEELAAKLHYPLTKIYVVDGSTRSGHSNAYMYGFWKNKRIVLYDTLLSGEEKEKVYAALGKEEPMHEDGRSKEDEKGMGVEEVVAVVAHELGHWALSHTTRQLVTAELNILLALFCFSFFHNNENLAAAFGFNGGAPPLLSLLVIMQYMMVVYNEASSLFTVFITRRMEFEADEYAAKLGFAPKLSTALIKLSKDNLTLPVNDDLYSLCRHTHPPVTERVETLKKFM